MIGILVLGIINVIIIGILTIAIKNHKENDDDFYLD